MKIRCLMKDGLAIAARAGECPDGEMTAEAVARGEDETSLAEVDLDADEFEYAELLRLGRGALERKASVLAQLRENDVKALRAFFDGDTVRINAHKATQAALRAQLE